MSLLKTTSNCSESFKRRNVNVEKITDHIRISRFHFQIPLPRNAMKPLTRI